MTTARHSSASHEQPIACSLSAADYRARTADLAALADRALGGREPIDGGERLTFTGGDDIERQLSDAVAAEASCCAFLSMDLRRDGDALILDVTGPDAARPIIADLFRGS